MEIRIPVQEGGGTRGTGVELEDSVVTPKFQPELLVELEVKPRRVKSVIALVGLPFLLQEPTRYGIPYPSFQWFLDWVKERGQTVVVIDGGVWGYRGVFEFER